jgi:hypothetical protein
MSSKAALTQQQNNHDHPHTWRQSKTPSSPTSSAAAKFAWVMRLKQI